MARCISLMPLFSTDGLIMLFVTYWMIGLNTSVGQITYAIILSLLSNQAASAFGIAMSCIFPTAQMTSVMASPLLVLFRLFGGFYGNTSTFPAGIRWLQYTSMYRYAFEGHVVNQWSSIDEFHPEARATWTDATRDSVLDGFSFSADAIPWDILGLIVNCIVFYLIGFGALLFRMKKAR
uniref:ABC2_membrane domain-containing protein n=1 Tax=Caenorhabditis japonica TaxID=281687 RepID=A0A8R1E5H7_CAEJA